MASTSSNFSTTNQYIKYRIVTTETATSVSDNTSTITVKVQAWRTNTGYTTYSSSGTCYCTINGTTYSQALNSSHKLTYNSYTELFSKSVTINHNSDGTKTISISAKFSLDGIVSSSPEWQSYSVTLTTIARASSISSAGNVTLGNACNIKWTPASASFRYKIKFAIGSWSYTTAAIHPNQTSQYTYTGYTIPLAAANQIPNATTGTMTAYLYTYSNSGATTQVGSVSNKTFTITVPSSVVPTLGTVTAVVDNSANSTINGWGVAVAGYSKIRVAATASGSYSSTIKSFTISGGYSTTQTGSSLSYTGSAITSSGSKTFTVTATDSRGRVSSSTTTPGITFYSYYKPTISTFTVARSSSDNTKIVVNASFSFAPVNNKNSATLILQYKKSSASSWTTVGSYSTNLNNVVLSPTFSETSSYNFRITVRDALNNSIQADTFVSTISVLMDFRAGGKGLAIGKIAESDSFEVALPTIFTDVSTVKVRVNGSDITLLNYIKGVMNGTYS